MKLDAIHFRTMEHVSLCIRDGLIEEISIKPQDKHTSLPYVGPGLIDLQLNGYKGMDFNNMEVTEDIVGHLTQALFQEGVTSYLPTVITNSDEVIAHEVSTIARRWNRSDLLAKAISGIHLEGPFISPEDGARGAHDKHYVKAPDWTLFQRWQDAAQGLIRKITLSPEWPGAIDFITRCVKSGIIVAIGHTAASPQTIREAVAAGASLSTHLGNGSHVMIPRHHNYLWEQLAHDDLWACFIADGFHLPLAFLKAALRAKGHRAMLVSDAVALSGMPPGEYQTNIGRTVVITPEGKLHLAENDKVLAGSAQMLPWGISHLVRNGLTSLSEAWEMASIRPATFIDLPSKRGLVVGAPADLVTFNWTGSDIEILQTIKSGELVFSSEGDQKVK